jgi:hypothetical protein
MAYENTPWLYPTSEIQFTEDQKISDSGLVNIVCEKVKSKIPFSLVRIGDGELTIMSQDLALTQDWLRKNVAWYGSTAYCGVALPDYKTRDRLIESVMNADIVGVYCYDEFINRVFSSIQFKPQNYCYAFVNVFMCYYKQFVDLIRENPPLLVGGLAQLFAEYLYKELGVRVPGVYTKISRPQDIEKAIEYMANTPHDWSLVSAGVNADIIAPIMAKQYGKICIDYGQGMDTLLDVHKKYNGRYYLNKGE